jgi:hypothetical protein
MPLGANKKQKNKSANNKSDFGFVVYTFAIGSVRDRTCSFFNERAAVQAAELQRNIESIYAASLVAASAAKVSSSWMRPCT